MRAARRFLSLIAEETRPNIDARKVAVVVAHPDDETIGCGALLRRLAGVTVIVVTDGAPENLADARARGFPDRLSYASARAAEFERVMRSAGVLAENTRRLGITDQQAAFHLNDISAGLARTFDERQTNIVLTHVYEGGHPDHDATAFGVHHASRRARDAPAIIEMPYYHAGATSDEFQMFCDDRPAVAVALGDDERALKQRLIAMYRTQRAVLAGFDLTCERFRIAPRHDFSRLPNRGRLLYEGHDWGLGGGQWLDCVRAAEQAVWSP